MDYQMLMQNSIDTIEAQLLEKVSINELARHSFFSKHHYQRLFHAVVGDTIMDYIRKRKLSLASIELCETDCSILDIALKYGYESHEGFTRAFKLYYGITPTECRKYGMAHLFDKVTLKKGEIEMSITKKLQYESEIFSDQAINALSDNTKEVLAMINDFIENAKRIASLAENKAKTDEMRFFSFSILPKQINDLVRDAEIPLGKIKLFLGDTNAQFQPNSFLQTYSSKWEILETLDDLAFRTQLITFGAEIEVARVGHEHRSPLLEVLEELRKLSNGIQSQNDKIANLFKELISLVSVEIANESAGQMKKMKEIIEAAAENVNVAYRFAKDKAIKMGDKGSAMLVLSEEANNIALTLQNLSERLTQEDGIIGDIVNGLKDSAFRVSLLVFNTEVEAARAGGKNDEINATLARYRLVSSFLQESVERSKNCFEELNTLLSLFTSEQSATNKTMALHSLDDICLQGILMSFHFKLEAARFKGETMLQLAGKSAVLADEARDMHSNFCKLPDQVGNSTVWGDDAISAEIKQYAAKIEKLAEEIKNEADALGLHGSTFSFLATAYEKYAHHIGELVHYLK